MKARWQKLAARYEAFSRREKAMVAAAAVGGVLLIGFSALVDPVAARNRTLAQSAARQSGEAVALETQIASLEAQLKGDPDAGRRAEIEGLKAAVREASEALEKLEAGLVPPERMNSVLDAMLKRQPGLKLLGLKTLPPAPLLSRPAGKGEKAEEASPREFELYRHGVEIRLEGSYADLHTYLAQLEAGPQKLLWGEARLEARDYPKAVLTLVIYTLNAEKAWLAI